MIIGLSGKSTDKVKLPRPDRPAVRPPKTYPKPPPIPASRVPWWGPATVGVGSMIYPRPTGCATLNCPDYQDIVREFCRQNPTAPNCQNNSDECN